MISLASISWREENTKGLGRLSNRHTAEVGLEYTEFKSSDRIPLADGI